VVALQADASSSAEQVAALRAELAASRALAADAAAQAAREAAASRDAAAAQAAALRAEVDALRSAVENKADRTDVAAAWDEASSAGALALDAAAKATAAAQPAAAVTATAVAAAVAAAEREARKTLCQAAHADDLDALGARLIAATDMAAEALDRLRNGELRSLAEAAADEAEAVNLRLSRLDSDIEGLRDTVRAAVLLPAHAVVQEVAAAADARREAADEVLRQAASYGQPGHRSALHLRRRRGSDGSSAGSVSPSPSPASVHAWRSRVLRSAGYLSVTTAPLQRPAQRGSSDPGGAPPARAAPPRPRAPSTRGVASAPFDGNELL
jgi:hypothetical protein